MEIIPQEQIAAKARKHAKKVEQFYSTSKEGYSLRAKNSYQAGYEDCMNENTIKFHKSFEALYSIAMNMADTCIGQKTIEKRVEKLEEEFTEVMEAYRAMMLEKHIFQEHVEPLENELADLLFVLLHIAHKVSSLTAFELLHRASSKMLGRMNDSEYIAKN